jgi:hypothetical protein
MSTVRIRPTPRSVTDGTMIVEVGGATVQEVVNNLIGLYPGLAGRSVGAMARSTGS